MKRCAACLIWGHKRTSRIYEHAPQAGLNVARMPRARRGAAAQLYPLHRGRDTKFQARLAMI